MALANKLSQKSDRRRGRIAAVSAAIVLLVVGLPADPAVAHDRLVGSSPTDGSSVARPPTSVQLTFSGQLPAASFGYTALHVTGPAPATTHRELACGDVNGRVLSSAVALGDAGRYTVTYRIASADGHAVVSTTGFTTTADAAPSTRAVPDCGRADALPTTASAAAAAAAESTGAWIAAGVSTALFVLLPLVFVLRWRFRDRRQPSEDGAD